MTKIRVILNWDLKNLKEIDVPTPFYEKSWNEVVKEGHKPVLANFIIGNKAFKVIYHDEHLFFERDLDSPYLDQNLPRTETR